MRKNRYFLWFTKEKAQNYSIPDMQEQVREITFPRKYLPLSKSCFLSYPMIHLRTSLASVDASRIPFSTRAVSPTSRMSACDMSTSQNRLLESCNMHSLLLILTQKWPFTLEQANFSFSSSPLWMGIPIRRLHFCHWQRLHQYGKALQ